MNADDPRHGTNRGYIVGCREQCCRLAHTVYMKLYRMGRRPRMVDPTGTQRRIEALLALGWTCKDIGQRCGRGNEWARMVRRSRAVTSETAALVARVYDEMCMTVPSDAYFYERNRRAARAKGYAPPLAWDDIDRDEAPAPYCELPRDLLAEWDHLRRSGESIEQAAKQLGVTVGAIERATERAKGVAA